MFLSLLDDYKCIKILHKYKVQDGPTVISNPFTVIRINERKNIAMNRFYMKIKSRSSKSCLSLRQKINAKGFNNHLYTWDDKNWLNYINKIIGRI